MIYSAFLINYRFLGLFSVYLESGASFQAGYWCLYFAPIIIPLQFSELQLQVNEQLLMSYSVVS